MSLNMQLIKDKNLYMIVRQAAEPNVTSRNHYTFSSAKSVMSSPEKLIPCLGHMLTKLTQ
mgnify:CR=1 FL=1|jgi:hypothetical protein